MGAPARLRFILLAATTLSSTWSCSSNSNGNMNGDGGGQGQPDGGGQGKNDAATTDDGGNGGCVPRTCAELGWACGYMVTCGEVHDCADEGLSCGTDSICMGGVQAPTQCVTGTGGGPCAVC